jgi:hypothetical protein
MNIAGSCGLQRDKFQPLALRAALCSSERQDGIPLRRASSASRALLPDFPRQEVPKVSKGIRLASRASMPSAFTLLSCPAYSSTPMMEEIFSSETLVGFQRTISTIHNSSAICHVHIGNRIYWAPNSGRRTEWTQPRPKTRNSLNSNTERVTALHKSLTHAD